MKESARKEERTNYESNQKSMSSSKNARGGDSGQETG